MITVDAVRNAIRSACKNVDADAIPADGILSEYGLDSLDLYEVLIELQTISGKQVADSDLENLVTIEGIVNCFSQ